MTSTFTGTCALGHRQWTRTNMAPLNVAVWESERWNSMTNFLEAKRTSGKREWHLKPLAYLASFLACLTHDDSSCLAARAQKQTNSNPDMLLRRLLLEQHKNPFQLNTVPQIKQSQAQKKALLFLSRTWKLDIFGVSFKAEISYVLYLKKKKKKN